ncbi:MAG: hypothetical protein K2Q14_02915 [Gammaproteobacteria bacterium]|nr:hypothetical protein [Gammaproteobacteria bacterium]
MKHVQYQVRYTKTTGDSPSKAQTMAMRYLSLRSILVGFCGSWYKTLLITIVINSVKRYTMNTAALETMVLKDWLIDVIAGNCPADLCPGIADGITAHYEDDVIKIKRIKSGHRFSLVTAPIEHM